MTKRTAAALVAALAFVGAAIAAPVHADELDASVSPFHPDDRTEELAHDLARTFISEGGFNDPRQHAALGWTIARRARRMRRNRGWSAQRTLRSIADRILVEPRTPRQHWLHALAMHGARPEGWETWTTARWNATRANGWKAAIDEARALIRGDLPDPCDGPSELWGSRVHPVDRHALLTNIASGTWVVVDCGLEGTAHDNVFVRWGTQAERAAAARRARPPRLRVRYVD